MKCRSVFQSILAVMVMVMIAPALSANTAGITNQDAASGLKAALTEGAAKAVSLLGAKNGYFGNAKVKIPLPPSLAKAEGIIRAVGMKKQADDLVLAMNRAAEDAATQAGALLDQSIRQMTVQDAMGILTGGDTAATDYFRRTTQTQLMERYLPIVKKATDQVGLAKQYNTLASKGEKLGLVTGDQATIERYVTQKALDGLYTTIGEQEKALRANPLGATSAIVKKVFGALK